jgi:glycosyltransferase involved in cell wall biosynthesis
MNQSIVDVLLPVFNGATTITEAIESLQQQTFTSFRIIVVDDGSTDRTPEVLAALTARDSRITVLTQPNGGIVDALNAGLRLCRAEFIARQDADDISDPSRLEMELDYFRSHPDCVAVSGAVKHIDEQGRFLGTLQTFPQPDCADPYRAPSREPYLMHPFLMVRRADLQAIGGYRYVYYSEDTDLCWRLQERGAMQNLDMPLGKYRVHTRSISSASVINGRIMALSSQLAGLSALRRRTGRTDLHFPKEAIREYRNAQTLSKLWEIGKRQLDDDEARYLRIALASKLLELTAYRPYELEFSDCQFIRGALDELSRLPHPNRKDLSRLYARAAARLLIGGRLREMVTLTPPWLYLPMMMRTVLKFLPASMRNLLARVRKAAAIPHVSSACPNSGRFSSGCSGPSRNPSSANRS